jgi:hypothetical protein
MRTEERIASDQVIIAPDDPRRAMLRAAKILSWVVLVLMVVSGAAMLVSNDLLAAESPWAREAFRGGGLISLFVAVPLMVGALLAVHRGSIRAQALWIGMLLYAAYNYAYAIFGSTFNDAFLVHIGAFSASIFALACAMPAFDYVRIEEAFKPAKSAKAVGIFLFVVGLGQGLLWLFILLRNAITGEVLHDIPVSGQHLVFALDLALLVPSLMLSGILIARRRPFGFLFGAAVAVMGAVYQLNLLLAGVYGAAADVQGAKAFPAESVILTIAFIVASLVLLLGGPAPGDATGAREWHSGSLVDPGDLE